jgi:hypothetical protein
LLIFVASVVPIAIYCLVLAVVNRRCRPLIVSGTWDFAGVLFAASGILLVGGPAILMALYQQWHVARLLGQPRYLPSIGEYRIFWIGLWILYFTIVACGSALMLWRRRRLTCIYNVEADVFTEALTQVLDRVGLEFFWNGPRRLVLRLPTKKPAVALLSKDDSAYSASELPLEDGNRLRAPVLPSHRSPAGMIPVVAEDAQDCPDPRGGTMRNAADLGYPWAELDLHVFPIMRHAALRWRSESAVVRPEVEARLSEALALVYSGPNPVAAWFVALALLSSAFVMLSALIDMQILRFRR